MQNIKTQNLGDQVAVNSTIEPTELQESVSQLTNDLNFNTNNNMKTITLRKTATKVISFKPSLATQEDLFNENPDFSSVCVVNNMVSYVQSLTQQEYENFEYFIDGLNNNTNYLISPKTYTNRNGIDYVYINIKYPSGGGEQYKLICFPGFEKFRTVLKTRGVKLNFKELMTYLGIEVVFE